MNRAPDCDTCLAWDADEPADSGVCRRKAPGVVMIAAPSGDGSTTLQTFTTQPQTAPKGEGCFDHIPTPDAPTGP